MRTASCSTRRRRRSCRTGATTRIPRRLQLRNDLVAVDGLGEALRRVRDPAGQPAQRPTSVGAVVVPNLRGDDRHARLRHLDRRLGHRRRGRLPLNRGASLMRIRVRRGVQLAVAWRGVAIVVLLICAAVARADYTVSSCGANSNEGVFSVALPPGGSVIDRWKRVSVGRAGGPAASKQHRNVNGGKGSRGAWQANAPAGLEIVAASVASPASLLRASTSAAVRGAGASIGPAAARRFRLSSTPEARGLDSSRRTSAFSSSAGLTRAERPKVRGTQITGTVNLSVRETTGPSLSAPTGLWQSKGWIRGQWPLNFSGSSPSGMCGLSGTLNQVPVGRDQLATQRRHLASVLGAAGQRHDQHGRVRLGRDAAVHRGLRRGRTDDRLHEDDRRRQQHPDVVDERPDRCPDHGRDPVRHRDRGWEPVGDRRDRVSDRWRRDALVPGRERRVCRSAGVGEHEVGCTAQNNAVNAAGSRAASPPRTWSLKIGQPTELGVAFVRYVGLKCPRRPQAGSARGPATGTADAGRPPADEDARRKSSSA